MSNERDYEDLIERLEHRARFYHQQNMETAKTMRNLLRERDEARVEAALVAEHKDHWINAWSEVCDINQELSNALQRLVDRYAAKTFHGGIVAQDEQFPWIAQAMKALSRNRSAQEGGRSDE